jgi:hypothetical protein
MSRPDKIVLGSTTWGLRFPKFNADSGNCDTCRHEIIVARSGYSPLAQRLTAVHEALHGALWTTPARALPAWSEEIEEILCLGLEGPVYDLLAHPANGPFRKWVRS